MRPRRGERDLDPELYLPKAWTDDRDRCAAAGIGAEVEFATKPELAMSMLQRAHDNGVPARWVTADEVTDSIPGSAPNARNWDCPTFSRSA